MEAYGPNRDRAGSVARIAPSRSKTTDRVEFLPNVDGRTLLARRWQQYATDLISDQGGIEKMSTARLFLCKRLAAVSAMIEEIEGKYIAGKKIDTAEYISLVQAATRLSNTIGLSRRAKTIPDLNDYLAGYANGDDEDEERPRRRLRLNRPRIVEHDEDDDD